MDMTRPIRDRDPDLYRLITIRTVDARLWISPSNNIRKLIGGIIARYQELLGIQLFAYIVLGNHIHLLARAPRGNIDEFAENVHREIARRLNWKLRREGKFWGRRYDDQPILSFDDLLEAFLYITLNAVRHGLVRDAQDWTGLHSYEHVLDESDRQFSFYHYSAPEGEHRTTRHKLRLSVLPQFADLAKEERRELISKLLVERMKVMVKEREQAGQGFLGMQSISEQEPGLLPVRVSRSPRPSCYTKCPELRKQFLEERRLRMRLYDEASARYRLGEWGTAFPENTFRPPTHRLPRVIPFIPMSLTPQKCS